MRKKIIKKTEIRKKKKTQKNKQNVKTKASFRQEKIAISNMHVIGNRTYKIRIQIKGMFTASSQRIKSSMTGGRLEAGISSQIPERNISIET